MKDIFTIIINFIAKMFSLLLHPLLVRTVSYLCIHITSEYIIKQLKFSGKNLIIFFPVTTNGLKNISIGDNFTACSRLRLETYDKHMDNLYTPEIVIGNNVRIGYDCHIGCVNKIIIGDNVLIASKVFITDHSHGDTTLKSITLPPNNRKVISKGPVLIEDNVWVGEGVVIMANVKIGKNSIIGANSVVTKDVEKNSVVAGNPARVIKKID